MQRENTTDYNFSVPSYLIVFGAMLIFSIVILYLGISLLIVDKAYFAALFVLIFPTLIFIDVLPKLIRATKCIIKNKPALILTKTQLIDNTNGKIIEWKDVKEVSYSNERNSGYIAIKLLNPEKYIDKSTNYYEKLIMRLNGKFFNGTFAVKPKLIKCKSQELYNQLKSHLENN